MERAGDGYVPRAGYKEPGHTSVRNRRPRRLAGNTGDDRACIGCPAIGMISLAPSVFGRAKRHHRRVISNVATSRGKAMRIS